MTDFEQFWAAYPRKSGKGAARKAFAKAITKTTIAKMVATLDWQRRQPQWMEEDGKYVPLPTTWLNQERWDDEPFHAPTLSERSAKILARRERDAAHDQDADKTRH